MVDFKSLVAWSARSRVPARKDDFFDPFVSFRREVDRMFDSFFDDVGSRALGASSAWQGATPAIDVSETDNEIIVTAEVPGVSENEIDVTIADNVLTIQGEKRAEHEEKNGNASYVERRYGAFSRSLRLPFAVKDAMGRRHEPDWRHYGKSPRGLVVSTAIGALVGLALGGKIAPVLLALAADRGNCRRNSTQHPSGESLGYRRRRG